MKSTRRGFLRGVVGLALGGGAVPALALPGNAVTADRIAARIVTAKKIPDGTLSAVNADLGTVTAGKLQSADGNMVIDLDNMRICITG